MAATWHGNDATWNLTNAALYIYIYIYISFGVHLAALECSGDGKGPDTTEHVPHLRQHTSAYVSIRYSIASVRSLGPDTTEHVPHFVIQHTSAYVSIRRHTSIPQQKSPTHSHLLPRLQRLYHQLMLVLEARIPVDLRVVEAVGEATLPHLRHKALFACNVLGVRVLLSAE